MGPRQNAQILMACHTSMFMAWHSCSYVSPFLTSLPQDALPKIWEESMNAICQEGEKLFQKWSLPPPPSLEDFQKFIEGFSLYIHSPFQARQENNLPVLWQKGSTRLLGYGEKYKTSSDAVPIVFVPSLINRGYIFDLLPGVSLFEYLVPHGFRPWLVEWDQPEGEDLNFNLDDYAEQRLAPLLAETARLSGRAPIIVGYCMGGSLSIKAFQYYRNIKGLGLLAVPGEQAIVPQYVQYIKPWLVNLASSYDAGTPWFMPAWLMQLYFHLIQPREVQNKFINLRDSADNLAQMQKFIATEDWLNDGLNLASPVVKQLIGTEAELKEPAPPFALPDSILAVVPAHDRIVPTESAELLLQCMPKAQVLRPPLGHIGMIISSRAKQLVWKPLVKWLQTLVSCN